MNALIGGIAGGAASFLNASLMRRAEVEKGIKVFADKETTQEVGTSIKCAEQAVWETACSRSVMSQLSCYIPASIMLSLGLMGINPRGRIMKTTLEVGCVVVALAAGLPLSIAMFEPLVQRKGKELEKDFHKYEYIYFNKGL